MISPFPVRCRVMAWLTFVPGHQPGGVYGPRAYPQDVGDGALYLFGAFLVLHLYMAVLADTEEGNAPITSMVSSWKFEGRGKDFPGED